MNSSLSPIHLIVPISVIDYSTDIVNFHVVGRGKSFNSVQNRSYQAEQNVLRDTLVLSIE